MTTEDSIGIRKTTITIPETILDGLQLFIAKNRGFTLRDQSKIMVTALVEFLVNRGIDPQKDLRIDDELVKKYLIESEMMMLRKTKIS
ncbi:MAG: hypothetical protein ACE14P_12995 [Methanotrichaceae archaeon]